ncbi:MAG: NUMOD4 motif-containing HNH endonuclease [Selenomonadaceae bacterium]|nr:NUMOD4 motif-containing HNH endonuclease [Selenomonadaceae bacterium]
MNDSYSQWLARRREESKLAYAALMKFYPLTLDDLPDEIWLPVPDYEGYHVSNFGRVKSFKRGKVKILKPAMISGYLLVTLSKDNKPKMFYVHRLVALAFIPNLESKREINHIDGHKLNNFVGNLEWCTPKENRQHAVALGLRKSGEDRPDAKLTNQQVRYIRENPDGLNIYKLAEMFGVNPTKISAAQRGETYKNAGGSIREAKPYTPRISDDIRKAIRAEYVFGSHEFGSIALAKKYGVAQKSILNIVNEVKKQH